MVNKKELPIEPEMSLEDSEAENTASENSDDMGKLDNFEYESDFDQEPVALAIPVPEPVMVHIQFIEDGIFFMPGENGIPHPQFYKKDHIMFSERKVYDQMIVQGLKVRAFAGG